tara:strand:- start:7 stop:480 length:474 start_codon:yes stop_codon:yes gene_type:complete
MAENNPEEDDGGGSPDIENEENKKLINNNNEKSPKIYIERRTFWGCSYKCIALTNAIFMIIDFVFEFDYFIAATMNKYFDLYYQIVYGLIIIPLFIGAIQSGFYLFQKERPEARVWITNSCWLAGISNVLVVIWISVYFGFFYPYNVVYMNLPDRIN